MSYLQIQKNRSKSGKVYSYVHFAESRWDSEAMRPVQDREYLGKLEDDGTVVVTKGFPNRSGERIPYTELDAMAKRGDDITAWLRTGGRNIPEGISISGLEEVGIIRLFRFLAEASGLSGCLVEAFGKKTAGALIALGAYQNVAKRPLYLADAWLADLPREERPGIDLSSPGITRLAKRLGEDVAGAEAFYRAWIKRLGMPRAVVYDTTSISTYGILELAEYGYNRDGERLPQVNLALAADSATGLPFYQRLIPGSVPDVRNLEATSRILGSLGLERFAYSLDKGFYSAANVGEMLKSSLEFTIGVPFSLARAREMLRRNSATLRSVKRAFLFNGEPVHFVQEDWPVELGGDSYVLRAFLYRDKAVRAKREARAVAKALTLEAKGNERWYDAPRQAREWIVENCGPLAKYFVAEKKGEIVRIRLKRKAMARHSGSFGHTLVLTTNRDFSADDALRCYRSRDGVEKLFDMLKNETRWRRLRTGVKEAAEGRIFMAFVALALRSELERRMRENGILKKHSIDEMLVQIAKIRRLRTASGATIPLEITKKQRDILAAAGAEPDIMA